MKNKSIKFLSFVSMVTLVTLGSGCGKIDDFGDTNKNPNAVTAPVPSALLSNAQSTLGDLSSPQIASCYCQYIAENQYTDASQFSFQNPSTTAIYAGNPLNSGVPKQKTGSMMDLQVLINTNPGANYVAIAKILKSYMIWIVTDRYGDVPYSEALLGAANTSPKYDKQLDVYKAMFKDLTEAAAGLDAASTVSGDLIYAGDVTKWKKLANSLRMMMALRLSKKYPAVGGLAQIEFKAALLADGGLIKANADNFTLVPSGGVFSNTWYETYDGAQRDDYGISKTMTDCLNGLGDTRSQAFTTLGSRGMVYGLSRDLAIAYGKTPYGRVLALNKRTQTSPIPMIRASNVLLAIAEGLERGWVSAADAGGMTANAAYDAGVTASFDEWGVAIPAAYLTTGLANYTSGSGVAQFGQDAAPYDAIPSTQNGLTTTALKRIQLQRWLSSFPNGNEGWAEWRRTGVPNLQPTKFATNSGAGIPRRFAYATNEYSLNPTQLNIAIGGLTGGDKQSSSVWWDQ